MMTAQRKQAILAALQQDGQVVAKELSTRFGVSEDTLRRDLREMAADGLLQRVHGGAMPSSPAVGSLAQRAVISPDAKLGIARRAARLVRDGQIAIIDGGTTAVLLARSLPLALRATVVTHSPQVACELSQHASLEVLLLGGRLYKHSMVAVGACALDAIAGIRADLYFMGATGIHADHGLSTGDREEAHIKRALAFCAGETILLASSEKLGAVSPYTIGPATLATTIIVSPDAPQTAIAPLEHLGLTVLAA
ncbi:MAG TPA: DeoR/GlpR family DNA-binding transcription regulator [Burkholderiaceae bacterium]